MTKPIRLEIRAKNNRLLKLREDLGLTQKAAAQAIGTDQNRLGAFENLKLSPVSRSRYGGFWKPMAENIASFYGVSCDEIWPEEVRDLKAKTATREVHAHELGQLASGSEPIQLLASSEYREAISRALGRLPERDAMVLRLRFGLEGHREHTLDETGEIVGTSRERTRQLEARAMAKIRNHDDEIRAISEESEEMPDPTPAWRPRP